MNFKTDVNYKQTNNILFFLTFLLLISPKAPRLIKTIKEDYNIDIIIYTSFKVKQHAQIALKTS